MIFLWSVNFKHLEVDIYLCTLRVLSDFVGDINLNRPRKCEPLLANCQRKLFATSAWAATFQGRADTLKTDLAVSYQELAYCSIKVSHSYVPSDNTLARLLYLMPP